MLSVLVCALYDGALSLISYHTLLSVEAAVLTATSKSLMWVPGVTVTTDDICTQYFYAPLSPHMDVFLRSSTETEPGTLALECSSTALLLNSYPFLLGSLQLVPRGGQRRGVKTGN